MANEDIEQLIARCALNDTRALERLYKICSAHLFGLILRIVSRRDWAEDVLQETFVSVWQKASSYHVQKGKGITWLITIARNRAIDWLRRNPHRVELSIDDAFDDISVRATTNDSLLFDTQIKQLQDCLESLQQDQRQAIIDAYFYGFTHQELADKTSKPLGTVKSWVRRGIDQLQKCLRL